MARRRESEYDKLIIDFLERKWKYNCKYEGKQPDMLKRKYFKRRKTALIGMEFDIWGVKETGNEYEERIETIGIEVKTNRKFIDAYRQALAYKYWVNNSCIAIDFNLKTRQKEQCKESGIGILQIEDDKIKVKLRPLYKKIDRVKEDIFLNEMCGIGRCTLCNMHQYFKYSEEEKDWYEIWGNEDEPVNCFGNEKLVFICDNCIDLLDIGLKKFYLRKKSKKK